MFNDTVFLITGGTGSFGNAVVRRLLKTDAREIRIFSRDEKKQTDMRMEFANPRLTFYLGDVRHYDSVDFAMHDVDYVFHAAALKQVPSCEFHPMEAVRTNILGTENVLNSCRVHGVKKIVVLSTDKAVYPINVMGISKAMLEKLMIAKSRTIKNGSLVCCGTRYGNVMASRGSVIPLFASQIKAGKPVTITDPNMTRFLLTLDGAVDLVIFAFNNARQGDMFVKKAPACTVGDLAVAMYDLFGADPDIRIIGTRHGEKLHETLLTREELSRAQDMGDFYRIPADTRDLNYDKYFFEGEQTVSFLDDYTSANTERLSVPQIRELMLTLEYIKHEQGVAYA